MPPAVATPLPTDRIPRVGWPAIRAVRVHGRDRWQVDERPHGGRHVHATEERARAAAHVARIAFGNAAAAPLPVADHVDAAREYVSRRATGNEPAAGALASWVESVEIRGGKTGRRFLALSLPLWRAFTAGKGQHPGDLPAGVLRRLWREARDRAAVTVPPDALRHSFASYWLPVHANRPRLAELMGNSPAIIARHYRRPVPVAQARRYWQAIRKEIRHAR